jgi:putative transposase
VDGSLYDHKRIQHFDNPFEVHELTFSTDGHRPLLAMTGTYGMLGTAVQRAVDRHQFDLIGFVFMPEHVHLLVKSRLAEYSTAVLLYAIKRPFSFRLKSLLLARASPLVQELTVRERPGKTSFRCWQEGPGYDRNLVSEDALTNSLKYIHRNPVRRGLCERPEDWRWSSFRQYRYPDEPLPIGVPRIRRLRV